MRTWWQRWRRRAAYASGVLVVVLTAALLAIGWIGAERATHPAYRPDDRTLAEFPQLRPEVIAFTSRDGTRLAGWFLAAGGGVRQAATIVLLSGYGARGEAMAPHAAYMHAAGYNVLLFDFRGRGASEPALVTVGAHETGDALGALDYLAARGDIDMRRIGFHGASMGAAVAIMAGAMDRRVAGVVAEAPFRDVPSLIGTEFEYRIGLPPFPFAPITVAILEQRIGVRASDISPERAVGGLSGRPLLVITDEADVRIPPFHQAAVFAAAGEPKERWTAPGAEHGRGHRAAPAAYEATVLAFWASAIGR